MLCFYQCRLYERPRKEKKVFIYFWKCVEYKHIALEKVCFGKSGIKNLLLEYEPIVVIGESSIHDLFCRYEPILVIINKLKMVSCPFRCVKFLSSELRIHEYHL